MKLITNLAKPKPKMNRAILIIISKFFDGIYTSKTSPNINGIKICRTIPPREQAVIIAILPL